MSLTFEVFILTAGSERVDVRSPVAQLENGTLGNGVVVGTPTEEDGVPNGSVQSERNVAKDALARSHNDGVSGAATDGTQVTSGGSGLVQ
jgi:hypothetical protein